ncbi:MAG TPA: hypothetical protein VKR61_19340 [Bryobacteraceae bacterium]|nr:hypothetical protein [Bryobacteraceae bacterium]
MLFLAASLLFLPHYEVTRASETGISLATDAKGYAYVITRVAGAETEFLSKFDPDGNLVYRVAPISNMQWFSGTFVDNAGDLYGVAMGMPAAGLAESYVTKIDPAGNVIFAFPVPGTYPNALSVGADGSIYLTGTAVSGAFQTTPGAWLKSAAEGEGVFAMKLNAAGQVAYATYLPAQSVGNGAAGGTAIAVDAAGNAYVGGTTFGSNFPTTSGAYQAPCCAPGGTAFLIKLNPAGSAAIYAALLPGGSPTGAVPDAAGNVALTVAVASVTSGNQMTVPAVITGQLSADGSELSSLVTTSYPGGMAVPDGQGNLLVSGQYAPTELPLSEGAFSNGTNFAAVIRMADGAVQFATLLPNGAGGGIAPDGSGGFVVLGSEDPGLSARAMAMLTRFTPAAQQQPVILGMANAAGSWVSEGLAPGEILGIYGSSLGPRQAVQGEYQNGTLPTALGGTEVMFNGRPAPLLWASSGQVNAVVPFDINGDTTANVQIRANGAISNVAQLPVLPADPGIFANSAGLALALNQDGSINTQQNPAAIGSIVTVFVNGAGLQTPTPADGTRAPFGPRLAAPLAASVQGLSQVYAGDYWPTLENCKVLYAGAAPGEIAGLLQVNFGLGTNVIPSSGPYGTPIQVVVGGLLASASLWVSSQ